jgi:tricorn protease
MVSGYYRFPAIYNDEIVFVSEDDLWIVPSQGGIARRLTSNLGLVSYPRLSPDGELLAFMGREEGQPEIFLMPALGGTARRITYLGSSVCKPVGWTRDNKIVFASNAGHWYRRFTHLYTIHPDGGAPERLNYGLADAIAFGPSGGVVIGRHTNEPAYWKRYRGGTVGQLWIDQNGAGDFHQLLPDLGNPTSPIWIAEQGSPGRIYFISDHEGVGNLYSCQIKGEDLTRHTHHEDFYVRNASTDGQRIVYHSGGDLYWFDPSSGQGAPIPVDYRSPRVQRNRKFVEASSYLGAWSLHPKGQSLAITSRGKAFAFANWEGAVTQIGEAETSPDSAGLSTGIRYRLPAWLPDGKHIIAVTDSAGEETFGVFPLNSNAEPEFLPPLDSGRPVALAVNPHKDQIVFSNHRYELLHLDLSSKELKRIDRGSDEPIGSFSWSPDGEWVAYSVTISQQRAAIKLWNSASGEITQITQPVLKDVAPAFDPEGKYLYFLSYRSFDPVGDKMQFDLGFPRGMKPYLITLQKDLTSPFTPRPMADEEASKESNGTGNQPDKPESPRTESETDTENQSIDHAGEGSQENSGGEGQKSNRPKPIQVDLDAIQQRVISFPVPEGIYGRVLGTHNGKAIYTRYPIEGLLRQRAPQSEPSTNGTLYMYSYEDQKEEMICSGVTDFTISNDDKLLLYRSGNYLRVIKAGEKPSEDNHYYNRKTGWIDLSRVKVEVNPNAEWRQMFREAWRLQRDQFWTEDMSSVDWLEVHNHYIPLIDRIGSRTEFSDLMWEMQGELGTSHAYEFGGDYRPEPSYLQGYLGADFEFVPQADAWRILHIYQGDHWDEEADSPLNDPGVNLRVGDYLLAINGKRLSRTFLPSMALVNEAGEEVDLTIQPGESREEGRNPSETIRTVTVKTLTVERPVRYREWVESNRRYVHAKTDDRIGYVHIPDMGPNGYAEFHRGYLSEVEREGLIVDVRYNTGGHVSALLLEKLARRRIGYDVSRWSQSPFPYPPESVEGPLVAITNEDAGSDGDIFSHGFKLMKLGPLIGKRTWGGVVGISPRHSLVDGSLTTQPEFSFWFSDVGWNVENYGTDPDIEVDILPQDYARGIDPQLERAIQEAINLLEAHPPQPPDFSSKPNKAAPKLPK